MNQMVPLQDNLVRKWRISIGKKIYKRQHYTSAVLKTTQPNFSCLSVLSLSQNSEEGNLALMDLMTHWSKTHGTEKPWKARKNRTHAWISLRFLCFCMRIHLQTSYMTCKWGLGVKLTKNISKYINLLMKCFWKPSNLMLQFLNFSICAVMPNEC